MDLIDGWPAIKAAIFAYSPASGLTERSKGFLEASRLASSPVDQAVQTCEALYAARADLDAGGRTLCGQLASFCAANGFHGMDSRGLGILRAMRIDLAEITAGDAETLPAALDAYAPAAPEGEG
jgi:hypothetical protein